MRLLTNEQFTTLYGHVEKLVSQSVCTHTLRRTRSWLQKQNCDVRANVEKIVDMGGHCDCEVLMNVTPDDWAARREEPLQYPDIVGDVKSSEFVSLMMLQAVQHCFSWDGGEA